VYQAVIAEMIKLSFNTPERQRLAALQSQLSKAQQSMSAAKTLDAWLKAG
jgi:hypothetical protein